MKQLDWQVIEVEDGNDINAIQKAIKKVKKSYINQL